MDFKQELTESDTSSIGLSSLAEHLPYYENTVACTKKGRTNMVCLIFSIDCEFKENEKAMVEDMMNSAAEMLENSRRLHP